MEITVSQTRSGSFAAFGATISLGLLGIGATAEAALSAGQAELARRRMAGVSSLASARAQGRVVAAYTEARKALRY